MHKTTRYLPNDLRHRLREHVRRTGSTQAAVTREALERSLTFATEPALTSLGAGDDREFEAADARAWLRDRWADEHA